MQPRLHLTIRTLLLLFPALGLLLMHTSAMYAQRAETPGIQGINTEGVPDAWVVRIILNGDQAALDDRVGSRTSLAFQLLLDGYLSAYGLKCSEYLPKDKVEWKLPTCEEEAKNQDGEYECVRRGEFHTHVWVDKNIWNLKHDLIRETAANAVAGLSVSPDPIYAIREQIDRITDARIRQAYINRWRDGAQLALVNPCLSPALRRFQDNLIRYAAQETMLSLAVPFDTPHSQAAENSPPLPHGLPQLHTSYTRVDYLQFMNDILASLNPGAGYPRDASGFKVGPVQLTANGAPKTVSVYKQQPNGYVYRLYILFYEGRPRYINVEPAMGQRATWQEINSRLVTKFESGAYGK